MPKLKKATDTAYFYKSFTTADKKDSVALINITQDTQERFRNFSFTNLTVISSVLLCSVALWCLSLSLSLSLSVVVVVVFSLSLSLGVLFSLSLSLSRWCILCVLSQ